MTVSLELNSNKATVIWRPRFIIYECGDGKTVLSPQSAMFLSCVKAALAGVLKWDSDVYPNPDPLYICGVKGQFTVNILDVNGRLYEPQYPICNYDFAAKSYRDSNVAIYLGKKSKAIVWDSFFWRKYRKLRIKMSFRGGDEEILHPLSRTSEHEFGHVLGLFDAYGYARKPDPTDGRYHYGGHPWPGFALPPALIDGTMLLSNSVMVCNYCALNDNHTIHNHIGSNCCFARTSLDYEMVLLAWRDNRLQLYTGSILGKRSKAFHDNNK